MDFSFIISQLDFLQSQNAFKLREILLFQFPQATNSELSELSESIFLSKRLKEKAFPFSYWNFSTQIFEQATDFRIATFHSEILKKHCKHILDGCGGAGFDSLAFSKSGFKVTCSEINQKNYLNLEKNKTIYQIEGLKLIQTNFLELNPNDFSAIYLDPMRRKDSGRFVELEDYEPSFSKILNWLPLKIPVLIKVSPLLKITDNLRNDFQLVYVGLNRECKEVLLARNIETLKKENLFIWESNKLINLENLQQTPNLDFESLDKIEFIYEPHSALLKSNRHNEFSNSLNLRKPSEDCGYFFGNNTHVEHLYERYQLIDKQYYKLSLLFEYLKNNPTFNFTFKKKNSNVDLEIYSRKMKWQKNQKELIIFISEVNGKTVFWVGSHIKLEY